MGWVVYDAVCRFGFVAGCFSVGGVVTEVLSTLMQACGLLPSP